jgi:porphobilinogen synthase
MVRETQISTNDLIAPLFIVPGTGIRKEISSLPGQYQLSVDMLCEEAKRLEGLGVPSVLLFGIPPHKDDIGAVSYDDHGIVQQGLRALRETVPNLCLIADLCFCEYTTHGHCGVIVDGTVDNDLTLVETAKQTVSLAKAGADIIAPSGMMDGMVSCIREALDDSGFNNQIIMSYAAKFASSYYGPFREAVDSSPQFGDRRSYQMDPANSDEALREIEEDIAQGADILMVKPALAYLDIIARAKDSFSVPLAAYNVSGEYSMIKNAAAQGLVDGEAMMLETLLSIKRAGADLIITYFAAEAAKILA